MVEFKHRAKAKNLNIMLNGVWTADVTVPMYTIQMTDLTLQDMPTSLWGLQALDATLYTVYASFI